MLEDVTIWMKPKPAFTDRLDLAICENCDGEGGWVKPPDAWEICQSCKGAGRRERTEEETDG